jgi:hypothetical protein
VTLQAGNAALRVCSGSLEDCIGALGRFSVTLQDSIAALLAGILALPLGSGAEIGRL